jgi:putative tryptophan/tyrosine transport system substrate-binding protein
MRRREFVGSLVGAAVVWSLAARAQQQALPVIGYLGAGAPNTDAFRAEAFLRGLQTVGYVDGQSVAIEYRWAEGRYDRFPALAADLVSSPSKRDRRDGRHQSCISSQGGDYNDSDRVHFGWDPIKLGLVTSFNRPTSNLTGLSIFW